MLNESEVILALLLKVVQKQMCEVEAVLSTELNIQYAKIFIGSTFER